jgi:transcriptional regulator with XRE-family HTH domain
MKQKQSLRKPGLEIRQILAANVRAARTRGGFSQEKLADIAGLHRTYVGAIERAERNVTLSTLEAFSKALGVAIPELLTPRRNDGNT